MPYKIGVIGWDMGDRFIVKSRKKWGRLWVYELAFKSTRAHWTEYQSGVRLEKAQAFWYDNEGHYVSQAFARTKWESTKGKKK